MHAGRVFIVGTGLMGTSIGLALRSRGLCDEVVGWDRSKTELETALRTGALDRAAEDPLEGARYSDTVVLAAPVLGILDWLERLAPVLVAGQLVTDVGSTKAEIAVRGARLYGQSDRATFLPGHPMAGKESGGAGLADGDLFVGAAWLFTPLEIPTPTGAEASARAAGWRECVKQFGARVMDMEARRHDQVCAWVSHLPQMVATALAAVLEEQFAEAADLGTIGGRALREMTRLGASPFSMWRDIAHTNTDAIARTLLAVEQRLGAMRENLRGPELREAFEEANEFRRRGYGRSLEASRRG
jgi:prephenate dehydrogenase